MHGICDQRCNVHRDHATEAEGTISGVLCCVFRYNIY